ncbi:hypothetical protein LCGC14_1637260, partial [marine sediment metagenome]
LCPEHAREYKAIETAAYKKLDRDQRKWLNKKIK